MWVWSIRWEASAIAKNICIKAQLAFAIGLVNGKAKRTDFLASSILINEVI